MWPHTRSDIIYKQERKLVSLQSNNLSSSWKCFFFFPTSNHRLCSQRQVDTIITKLEPGSQFSDDSDIRTEAGEKDVHSPPLGLDRGRMTQS